LNHRPIEKWGAQLGISSLNALALRSLITLFDEKAGLFSRSMTFDENGVFHRQKTSEKRTIIALLGLHRLKASGETLPFDLPSICDVVLRDTRWVRSLEELGLLTWFIAECEPDRLRNLFSKFDFENALCNYSDGRQGYTRALAWFLAGIAHARMVYPRLFPDLTDLAVDTYHLLEDNQSESGLFGHATSSGLAQHLICSRFGTFGDQIHPIYTLTVFAKAFQVEEPLASALSCGNAICALQGELGQWWFLYDKRSGRVLNRYPVFSMHQHGTAPVGLLSLGEATGQSFYEPIYRGLSWIMGANELGQDVRNEERTMIWDSLQQRRLAKYCEIAHSLVHIPSSLRPDQLNIHYEARPDHFGWLLYAFGRLGLPETRFNGNAVTTRLNGIQITGAIKSPTN
jgi:hypothetical protein